MKITFKPYNNNECYRIRAKGKSIGSFAVTDNNYLKIHLNRLSTAGTMLVACEPINAANGLDYIKKIVRSKVRDVAEYYLNWQEVYSLSLLEAVNRIANGDEYDFYTYEFTAYPFDFFKMFSVNGTKLDTKDILEVMEQEMVRDGEHVSYVRCIEFKEGGRGYRLNGMRDILAIYQAVIGISAKEQRQDALDSILTHSSIFHAASMAQLAMKLSASKDEIKEVRRAFRSKSGTSQKIKINGWIVDKAYSDNMRRISKQKKKVENV